MRKRVEDLGRICVMIDHILEEEIWDLYQGRKKDFVDDFNEMEEDKQYELLHGLIYGLDGLKDKLYEISSIAEGTDRLNESAE